MLIRSLTILFSIAVLLVAATDTRAQDPDAMKLFKADVGDWNCEIRMFEPGSDQPQVSKGTETNKMLGDMWLISHFKGEMMGMPFEGASFTGYNAETKKFHGTWIDSMSPFPMANEGNWDETTRTMTSTGTGKDPTGAEMKYKMTMVHKDGARHFTMFMVDDEDETKMMEIHYTRAKGESAKGESKAAPAGHDPMH